MDIYSGMTTFRSVARVFALLVGGLALFILAVVGALLLINSFDERLAEAPRATLEARHDTVTPADNLFFAVLGLSFEGDANPNDRGRAVYAHYLQSGPGRSARQRHITTTPPFQTATGRRRRPIRCAAVVDNRRIA